MAHESSLLVGGYQLALFDVDGTLRQLNQWNDGALELIAELHTAGVHVALCSGRSTGSLTSIVRDIPGVEFVASGSGSTVLRRVGDQWHVVEHRRLPREAVDTALATARELGIEVWGFTDRAWIVAEYSERVRREMDYIDDDPIFDDLALHADEFGKVLFLLSDPAQAAAIRARNKTPGTMIVLSGHNYLDLVTKQVQDDKGGGLIVEALGTTWERTIAMGDSENDQGMLRNAALAVCIPPNRVTDLGPTIPGKVRLNADDTAHARAQFAGLLTGLVE